MINCDKCLDNDHEHVCDCTHPHKKHVFAGGCTIKIKGKPCPCECYSQKKLRKVAA